MKKIIFIFIVVLCFISCETSIRKPMKDGEEKDTQKPASIEQAELEKMARKLYLGINNKPSFTAKETANLLKQEVKKKFNVDLTIISYDDKTGKFALKDLSNNEAYRFEQYTHPLEGQKMALKTDTLKDLFYKSIKFNLPLSDQFDELMTNIEKDTLHNIKGVLGKKILSYPEDFYCKIKKGSTDLKNGENYYNYELRPYLNIIYKKKSENVAETSITETSTTVQNAIQGKYFEWEDALDQVMEGIEKKPKEFFNINMSDITWYRNGKSIKCSQITPSDFVKDLKDKHLDISDIYRPVAEFETSELEAFMRPYRDSFKKLNGYLKMDNSSRMELGMTKFPEADDSNGNIKVTFLIYVIKDTAILHRSLKRLDITFEGFQK